MNKKVVSLSFLLSLISTFALVFAQVIPSDPLQEDKKEFSENEKKALQDLVLTAPQPAFNPRKNE